jgi:hypothetical protein
MIDEFEKFGATIQKHHSGTHFITVPINVIKFSEWNEGDTLVVMAKRKKEVEQNES